MYPDSVVNPIGRRLTVRGVRCDDQNFVSGSAQMLDYPQHRVGDAVDIREKGLGNDRDAHALKMAAVPVQTVAGGDTTLKELIADELGSAALPSSGMRVRRSGPLVPVVLLLGLLLALTGCTQRISGTAQPDPRGPGVATTPDGYGITAGFPEAMRQLVIFTEPQCARCIALQREHGEQLAELIGSGRLAVTYRPLTYLDTRYTHHSAVLSNAMFLAARPGTSAAAFQDFVAALHLEYPRLSPRPEDFDVAEVADDSGLPSAVVDDIADGDVAVDAELMEDVNFDLLMDDAFDSHSAPTVYDSNIEKKIDIDDDYWLDEVMAGR